MGVDLHEPSMVVALAVHTLTDMTVLPESSFSASAPVATVKAEVEAASGIPVLRQSLIWQGCILKTNTLLGSLDLPTEGAVLQLAVTIPPEEQVAQARLLIEEATQALDSLSMESISELRKLCSHQVVLTFAWRLFCICEQALFEHRGRLQGQSEGCLLESEHQDDEKFKEVHIRPPGIQDTD